MKIINVWNYLKLDSYGVELYFSKSRTELIRFLEENNIPMTMLTDMKIVVKSKILSLDFSFYISCQFDDEKMIAITMSPNTALEGKCLLRRYRIIQKALEYELGPPRNRLRSIMCVFDPENRSSYWMRNDIKIEHYLSSRFGTEENINIQL